jgi:hypothetical protein
MNEPNPQWSAQAKALISCVRAKFRLDSDAEVSRFLDMSTSQLSNFKTGRKQVGAAMKLRLIERAKMTATQINKILEDAK